MEVESIEESDEAAPRRVSIVSRMGDFGFGRRGGVVAVEEEGTIGRDERGLDGAVMMALGRLLPLLLLVVRLEVRSGDEDCWGKSSAKVKEMGDVLIFEAFILLLLLILLVCISSRKLVCSHSASRQRVTSEHKMVHVD